MNGKKLLSKKMDFHYPRRSKDPNKNQIFPEDVPAINKWLDHPLSAPLPKDFYRNQLSIYSEILEGIRKILSQEGYEVEWCPDSRTRIKNAEVYQDFHSPTNLPEMVDYITRAICRLEHEPNSIRPQINSGNKADPCDYVWKIKVSSKFLKGREVYLKLYQKSTASFRLEIQARNIPYLPANPECGFKEMGSQISQLTEELTDYLRKISHSLASVDPKLNDEDQVLLTQILGSYLGDLTSLKNSTCVRSFLEFGTYTPSHYKGNSISQWMQAKLSAVDGGICNIEKPPSRHDNAPKTLRLRSDWKSLRHGPDLENKVVMKPIAEVTESDEVDVPPSRSSPRPFQFRFGWPSKLSRYLPWVRGFLTGTI